jgi:hypothetical protein
LTEAEHSRQGIALRPRKPLEPLEQWRAQLMQRGEGKLHLGLDPSGPDLPHVRHRVHRVLEQCRFSNPGLALQNDDSAAPSPGAVDQPLEDGGLVSPIA